MKCVVIAGLTRNLITLLGIAGQARNDVETVCFPDPDATALYYQSSPQ